MAFWSAFFPLLLVARGYGPEAVAFYFFLRAVADTAARPVIWTLTARIAPRRALILTLVAGAASLAMMALVRSQAAMSIAVLVFGVAVGMYVTLSAIDVTREFSTEAAGLGVGMRMMMSRVGIVLGPILLGLVVESLGYSLAFVVGAAVSGAPALLYGPQFRAVFGRRSGGGAPVSGRRVSDREE
jgi:predicted MFS family arabinose efflux permease